MVGAAHDEFAIVLDGKIEVELVKLATPPPSDERGSIAVQGEPVGKKMGWVRANRGHQVLLPKGAAYRFRAASPAVILMQTMLGKLSVQKWAEICYK